MVDYSKWDKFASEVSDEEEEELSNKPRVTKLDGARGGQVVIAPSGASIVQSPVSASVPSLKQTHSSSVNDKYLLNGGQTENYMWSQDRYEAILRIILPLESSAKNIRVCLSNKQLTVKDKSNPSFSFCETLEYDVEKSEDDIDWEITNLTPLLRVLVLCFKKQCPIQGATIWWKKIFQSGVDIDLSTIQGRNTINNDVWQKAHEMFRERVRSEQVTNVDLDTKNNTHRDET